VATPCPALIDPDDDDRVTCSAIGDPHYHTWNGDAFGFFGQGVYELGRFTTRCGCEVAVQAFRSNLLKGWGLNAGMAAMAVRVADTTFQITGVITHARLDTDHGL
jgi:hypothetical protein